MLRQIHLILLLLFFCFPALAVESGRTTAIQFSTIPVTNGTGSEWRTVYFPPIFDIKAGDTIQAYAEGQVRNDTGINVEVAQLLELRANVAGGSEQPESPSINDAKINGWDVDSVMHYGRFSKGMLWKATQDYQVLYLGMRIRLRSTGAQPGMFFTVNANQGEMFYLKFR